MRKTHVHYKNKDEVIYQLIKANPYIRSRKIAEKLNLSVQAVNFSTNALKKAGRIKRNSHCKYYVIGMFDGMNDFIDTSSADEVVINGSVKNSIVERIKAERIAVKVSSEMEFESVVAKLDFVCDNCVYSEYGETYDCIFWWGYESFNSEKEGNLPAAELSSVISYEYFMKEYTEEKRIEIIADVISGASDIDDEHCNYASENLLGKPKHIRLYEAMISGQKVWSFDVLKRKNGDEIKYPDSYVIEGMYYSKKKEEFQYMGKGGWEFVLIDEIFFTEKECQQDINEKQSEG